MKNTINAKIDIIKGTINLYGVDYSLDLFESYAETMPLYQPFQLIKREDGVITIQTLGKTTDIEKDIEYLKEKIHLLEFPLE